MRQSRRRKKCLARTAKYQTPRMPKIQRQENEDDGKNKKRNMIEEYTVITTWIVLSAEKLGITGDSVTTIQESIRTLKA
jgi:hypothetical protein